MRASRRLRALALAMALPLAACQHEPARKLEVVNTTSYPELPDIPMPPEPALIPWEYEVPRDTSKFEPKNEKCRAVAEDKRDDDWDRQCGVHPVVADSNVLYGFDQRNWNIMLSNLAKLREYIAQLKERLELANQSRREWRVKAQEQRDRAAKAGIGTAAPPAPPGAASETPVK